MRKIWFVVAGCLAGVGLLVGLAGACSSGGFTPRSYVSQNFQRMPSRDIGREALAYTSPIAPSLVADQITRAWSPAGRYVDGSGIYLRYSNDSIVLKPNGTGTLILVEGLRTAYNRYAGTVGGTGWVGRGDGNSGRGGGPGTGK